MRGEGRGGGVTLFPDFEHLGLISFFDKTNIVCVVACMYVFSSLNYLSKSWN